MEILILGHTRFLTVVLVEMLRFLCESKMPSKKALTIHLPLWNQKQVSIPKPFGVGMEGVALTPTAMASRRNTIPIY